MTGTLPHGHATDHPQTARVVAKAAILECSVLGKIADLDCSEDDDDCNELGETEPLTGCSRNIATAIDPEDPSTPHKSHNSVADEGHAETNAAQFSRLPMLFCLTSLLAALQVSGIPVRGFLVGASSAMLAAALSHPLDLLKVRLQLQKASEHERFGALAMTRQIFRERGFQGFTRGVTATLLRQFINTGTRIASYQAAKQSMPSVFAAMLAGVTGALIGSPAEVALVRLQAGSASGGVIAAILHIARAEGLIALWGGIGPSLIRAVLVSIGQMTCYDLVKDVLLSVGLREKSALRLLASIVAGFCAAALSNPVDVVKTRLQASGTKYANAYECTKCMVRDEGLWSLNGGLLATCARMVPYVTIMLLVHDALSDIELFEYSGSPQCMPTNATDKLYWISIECARTAFAKR